MTKDDMALVTESAATNKSFLKLRFPLVLVFKFDILTGISLIYKYIYLNNFSYTKRYNYITC